jgi:putative phosphoribosyl transferase
MKTFSRLPRQTKQTSVTISTDGVKLDGDLSLPEGTSGIVLFVYGCGSNRHSPRNQMVAHAIREAGVGTLLFDLLTNEEEAENNRAGAPIHHLDLLAKRVVGVTRWLGKHPVVSSLKVGYFAARTGSAAALMAAAELGGKVCAIVSRGGRPDLAGPALRRVRSSTLLIVGSHDRNVGIMNQEAFDQLQCEKDFQTVPGATHLFAEPGKLEQVAQLSANWFRLHMGGGQ